ncbi:MAG: iron-containing alcohol dehydrogenase [Pirellulales bacterium]|nr:iron-containing alcohol dehydrogenase [Pirellulales bacterium]
MTPFDLQVRTRIVFGPGVIQQVGELAQKLGAKRVLVVSDPGICQAGHTAKAINSLQGAGLTTEIFSGVGENPTTEHVAAGLAVARDFQPDLLIGMGGGSSMDCAKGINFLFTNGGEIRDYWGIGKAREWLLPMIGIPTTAGTGSEAQSFALISTPDTHVKMACGDKKAAFRIAILDPELTLTQPPRVTALTGIDALSHAVESYVTKSRNPASMMFAREAWRLLAGNLHQVLLRPDDLQARGAMQLGACLAGLAIENSMLGGAHSLANPLTARYDVVHGQAVAVVLPAVIRYNGREFDPLYHDLLAAAAGLPEMPPASSGSAGLAEFVHSRIGLAGLKDRLRDLDVNPAELPRLAEQAAEQWTAAHNPRPLTKEDCLALYQEVW